VAWTLATLRLWERLLVRLDEQVGVTPGPVVVSRPFRRSTFVAYEVQDLGNGKYEIRTTSGRTCYIV
jgi:hypothetical protein